MLLVATYDVCDNRRRTKVRRILSGWLSPVERSVFEGHLVRVGFDPLERALLRTIDPATDSVRLYPLCRSCAGGLRLHGVATPTPRPRAPLFF